MSNAGSAKRPSSGNVGATDSFPFVSRYIAPRSIRLPASSHACYWPAGTTGPDSMTPHAMRDPASPVASVAGSGPATITGGSLGTAVVGWLGPVPGLALAIGEAVGAGAWYRS